MNDDTLHEELMGEVGAWLEQDPFADEPATPTGGDLMVLEGELMNALYPAVAEFCATYRLPCPSEDEWGDEFYIGHPVLYDIQTIIGFWNSRADG